MEHRLARLYAAIGVAPIGGAMAAAFCMFAYGFFVSSNFRTDFDALTVISALNTFPAAAAAGAIFGSLIGLPIMLLFGLPAHSLLTHLRRIAWYDYAAPGVIIGAIGLTGLGIPGIISGLLQMRAPLQHVDELAILAFYGAIAGGVSAATFWLIRRPDRDQRDATNAE